MNASLPKLLLFILFLAVLQALVVGEWEKTRIIINEGNETENCTRDELGTINCCNITINETFYPCWIPIFNGTTPNNTAPIIPVYCEGCPAGTYSSNVSDAISSRCGIQNNTCAQGTCMDSSLCEQCWPGSYAASENSTECTMCDVGYYSNSTGAQTCGKCPRGTWTNGNKNQTGCTYCEAGTYGPDSVGCYDCSAGSFSGKGWAGCRQCPPGSFSEVDRSIHCAACAEGTYNQNYGVTTCLACPPGSYCPTQNTVDPNKCPAGSYCAGGAVNAVPCAKLYGSQSGEASCKPIPVFYVITIGGSCGFLLVLALGVWRWRAHRTTQEDRQNKQLEIDRLIPKPADGPVYKGL